MDPVLVSRGDSPVILAFPHVGTDVPDAVYERLNDEGRLLRDTDWHIHDLYAGLLPDATTVTGTQSRYVIDVNRDPSGESLYPGQTTTGLISHVTFDDVPIWREGQEPGAHDIALWLDRVHRPYHAALAAEIARVKASHGVAILYDCHSIRSVIPWLFDGILPDFNIGTNGGLACDPGMERAVARICAAAAEYTSVVNGRFRGGWTTRHYGDPANNVHAMQMELSQISHLSSEDLPFALDPEKSAKLRLSLAAILDELAALASELCS